MKQKKGELTILPTPKPLSEKAIEARKAYQRSYYQANKDRRKLWNNRYWEKRASQAERQED